MNRSPPIPIGADVQSFRETLRDPETAISQADLDERYRDNRLVLGVERLDYTKGIPQKIEAFERFLKEDPDRAETTTMLQVLVPSRLQSAEYRAQRDEIEGRIAHVNGRFGQPGRTHVLVTIDAPSHGQLAIVPMTSATTCRSSGVVSSNSLLRKRGKVQGCSVQRHARRSSGRGPRVDQHGDGQVLHQQPIPGQSPARSRCPRRDRVAHRGSCDGKDPDRA